MISHNHTDHITDAPICIEGMTNGCYEKKGILVGPKTIYEDHENFKSLSNYHLNACKTKILAEPGKEIKLFDGLKVKVAPTEHNEPYGVGYIFETEDIQVSYLGDTAYFEGLEDYHKDSDVLIFNLISPDETKIDATSLHTVYNLLGHIKPKLVLLTHFGLKIIIHKLERTLSKKIYEKFGINTFVVYDFDWYDFGKSISHGKASFVRFLKI
jgi:ribonuclease BN (tRNA processing enzyme)